MVEIKLELCSREHLAVVPGRRPPNPATCAQHGLYTIEGVGMEGVAVLANKASSGLVAEAIAGVPGGGFAVSRMGIAPVHTSGAAFSRPGRGH